VCGFKAQIGDRVVIAQTKEKVTARNEYEQAKAQGHGAYLLEQKGADVFEISVSRSHLLRLLVSAGCGGV